MEILVFFMSKYSLYVTIEFKQIFCCLKGICTLKVIIASPYLSTMRGNSLTAKRIIHSLRESSIEVTGIDYNVDQIDDRYRNAMIESDILHILNPIRYIQSALFQKGIHREKRYGITFTGTDINLYFDSSNEEILSLLDGASFITLFHRQVADTFLIQCPQYSSKTHVVSQGYYQLPLEDQVDILAETELDGVCVDTYNGYALRFMENLQEQGYQTIILPAGIRKVKRVPWAIRAVGEFIRLTGHNVFLCIVGPEIEALEMNKIEALLQEAYYAKYFPEVPHHELLKLTRQADVLLNCSESEGQSQAIIEAFYQKTPVIASACAGNEQMIEHGVNGYLFQDEQGFFQCLEKICYRSNALSEIVEVAYERALHDYSAKKEVEKYIALYTTAIHKY